MDIEQKRTLVREKRQELQEVTRFKQQSERLLQYFDELTEGFNTYTDGVQRTAYILAHWEDVFRIMTWVQSDENTDKENNTLVRLPIVNPSAANPLT
ncbi:hypothetical protein BCR43DRAFT_525632 [Syncephalastrum racemosum]|uniref:Uncharacterized protein n=1 Tax=Syncephalastrum racemosum TaxID=13706 RepID=A0A1X2H8I3_SYNRA|nr:hypothetical protein BCR43DRAFT_525632 [Syncephalastrum racemosum]